MNQSNREETRQRLGNITQIRDLLFGEQIDQYEQRFVQLDSRIENSESTIAELKKEFEQHRSEISNQLEQLTVNFQQLQDSLTEKVDSTADSLDKKFKYLSVNTYTEINNIQQEVQSKTNSNYQKVELITDNLSAQLQSIKNQSYSHRNILEKDINSLKQQLTSLIEENLSELADTKVSRGDLAEVLFELCLKIKGTSIQPEAINPQSHNGNVRDMEGEILLLEEINT